MDDKIKIAVFGGSRATGQIFIGHALESGLEVKILARNPGSLKQLHKSIKIYKGSLLNISDVEKTINGTDAVFCLFSPRPPYTDIFCKKATENIIKVMAEKK